MLKHDERIEIVIRALRSRKTAAKAVELYNLHYAGPGEKIVENLPAELDKLFAGMNPAALINTGRQYDPARRFVAGSPGGGRWIACFDTLADYLCYPDKLAEKMLIDGNSAVLVDWPHQEALEAARTPEDRQYRRICNALKGLSENDALELWNYYAREDCCGEGEICWNGSGDLQIFLPKNDPERAAGMLQHYSSGDKYFTYDPIYDNINSFNRLDDKQSPFESSELAEYLQREPDALEASEVYYDNLTRAVLGPALLEDWLDVLKEDAPEQYRGIVDRYGAFGTDHVAIAAYIAELATEKDANALSILNDLI